MKIPFLRTTVLSLLSVIVFTACQVREETPSLARTAQSVSPKAQFVPQSVPELFARFENAVENEVIAFDLPNGTDHPWRVEAWRDGFLADDFIAGSASGERKSPEFSAKDFVTLTGVVVGATEGKVSLVLTRELMGGSIEMAEETYLLSPPALELDLRAADGFMLEAASAQAPVEPGICGWKAADAGEVRAQLPANARTAAPCSKVQVRVNGDYEYFRDKAGGNLNLATFALALTMHDASKKFAYVGNVLELSGIVVYTTSAPPFYYAISWNIYELVEQTRNAHNFYFPNPNWDAMVLFSGKATFPSTVPGVPDLYSSVCRFNGKRSFAVIRLGPSYSANVNVTVHNVAHLLGASHTTGFAVVTGCRNNSIMQPSVPGNASARLTHCTRDEMLFYRFINHSCMSPGTCSQ